MTEYHCWICIRYDAHDTDLDLQAECVSRCESYLESHRYLTKDNYKIVKHNGIVTFLASGLHNHNDGYITQILTWLGQNAPGSYGIVYYQDDEAEEMLAHFKVLVMRKGRVTETADPFLSPRIPTIEDETDWTRD